MVKGKVISFERAMVRLDLGTRLIKVNMTKIRKDEAIPPGKPEVDLLLPDEKGSSQNKEARRFQRKGSSTPAPKPSASRPSRIDGGSKSWNLC